MKLIELIFVISLLITFFYLTPMVYKNVCEYKINQFIDSLNHNIHYGQDYTVTHFTLIKLQIYPNDYYYRLIDGSYQYVKIVHYDKSIKIDSYITNDTIEMSHGYVNDFYYLYLSCGNVKYKVSIYEKSGIIYATKV